MLKQRSRAQNGNHHKMAIMNLTYKSSRTAVGKLPNGLISEQASEAIPAGPPIGGNPAGSTPGNTEGDLGIPPIEPSDSGAGAGANIVSRITEVGGAISGGNFCGPA